MPLYSEDPYKFRVGDEDILHGLTHGVSGMCNGERRRLRIPPELAYGDVNGGEVEGYSVDQFRGCSPNSSNMDQFGCSRPIINVYFRSYYLHRAYECARNNNNISIWYMNNETSQHQLLLIQSSFWQLLSSCLKILQSSIFCIIHTHILYHYLHVYTDAQPGTRRTKKEK